MKNRITTGIFNPNGKCLSFMTTMFCLDCENFFNTSRISKPCPYCASSALIPAANWSPARHGMPKLDMGKVKVTDDQQR